MSSRQILNHTVPCAVKRAGIADVIGPEILQPGNQKRVIIGFCPIKQSSISPIVCFHQSNQNCRAHSGCPRRSSRVVPWTNERRVAWSFPPLFLSGDPPRDLGLTHGDSPKYGNHYAYEANSRRRHTMLRKGEIKKNSRTGPMG
jgi:hypothetical protein